MPSHFQKPWTKWDYVNDIIDHFDFDPNESDKKEELERNLYKMNIKSLATLYWCITSNIEKT